MKTIDLKKASQNLTIKELQDIKEYLEIIMSANENGASNEEIALLVKQIAKSVLVK